MPTELDVAEDDAPGIFPEMEKKREGERGKMGRGHFTNQGGALDDDR